MKVGVVGLGRMGCAIAQRLMAKGCDVVGWDRSQGARERSAGHNIRIAQDAATIAGECSFVISIITEDNGARELFHGSRGLLSADVAGKLFVEMSTLQPGTARELAIAVEASGARFIDSPVLGSIPTVREGKLLALVGGSPQDVEMARPVHEHLTRKVVHLGPVGSGDAMKLAVNLVMATYLQSLSEALALGQMQGLGIPQMLDVLSEAPTANSWLALKKDILKGGAGDITMDIRTMRKDVMSATATGALAGITMPVAAGALSALSAAVASNWGEQDLAQLPRFFRETMLQTYA